eukprot:m.159247 g.159247  ORF g.159247 m.159247 type:complete len:144 (-) comp53009_c0_seq4:749-1180(-)
MSARAVLRERALAQLVPFHVAAWARGLPAPPPARLPLATAPTPIQPFALPGLVGTSNFKLSIKRDDLTGSVLTGNKVCLDFLFGNRLVYSLAFHVLVRSGLSAASLSLFWLMHSRPAMTASSPAVECSPTMQGPLRSQRRRLA